MALSDLLTIEAILPDVKANSKKQVLHIVAGRAAAVCGRSETEILDTLMQRERLGSTGVGHGVAIPHGKLAGLARHAGVFLRLDRPVDFDALDGEPVDLVFALLAPDTAGPEHLKALARVARVLRDPAMAAKLRASDDATALYALIASAETSDAA